MDKVNFGFRKVERDEKQGLVNKVFSSVSSEYDLMNDIMSFGLHRLWKDKMISLMPDINGSLIDVAGGTGDIAFKFYKKRYSRLANSNLHNKNAFLEESPYLNNKQQSRSIYICDLNPDMLHQAKLKAIDQNILDLNYINANAESLPFPDNSFDYYTISFGIRNVTDVQKVIKEAYRVLKPRGKFLCMEFAKVDNSFVDKLYKFYSFNLVPTIGKVVAKNFDAYQYLVESINKFLSQDELLELMKKESFREAKFTNLSFGITSIYTGYKI